MLLLAEYLAKTANVAVVSLFEDEVSDLAIERGVDIRPVFSRSEALPGRTVRWWKTVQVLRQEIRRIGAQVVLSNTARGLRFCWPAARAEGCRLVTHQREIYQKNYFHLGSGLSNRIITISEFVRLTLSRKLRDKATTVYNPIRLPGEAELGPKADAGWTRRWRSQTVSIGVAGLCFRTKGQDLLLRAAPTLLAKYPNLTFHIWGASAEHSRQDYLDELKLLASRVQDRVVFEPFRSDVEVFFREMDIVVQPSRVLEGFGRVAAEAISFATPTIAAGHGGLTEVIRDGQTGWLHKPDDHEDLARVILGVLDDPVAAEKIARAGREYVKDHFEPSVHASAVAELLGRVTEAGHRRKLVR